MDRDDLSIHTSDPSSIGTDTSELPELVAFEAPRPRPIPCVTLDDLDVSQPIVSTPASGIDTSFGSISTLLGPWLSPRADPRTALVPHEIEAEIPALIPTVPEATVPLSLDPTLVPRDYKHLLSRILQSYCLRQTIKNMSTPTGPFSIAGTAQTMPVIAKVAKTDRRSLDIDQRLSLEQSAQAKCHALYKQMPQSIEDPKQLRQYYALEGLIKQTIEHLADYDMDDVFVIQFPQDETLASSTLSAAKRPVNILTHYQDIDIKAVALSNKFYHMWTVNANHQMHTNLRWSYYFLRNQMDYALWNTIQSKYSEFEPAERGGPLLFALMIKELLYTSDSVCASIKDHIKSAKISDYDNENVKFVCAIIKSGLQRLRHAGKSFPDDMIRQLITVLRTSSVPAFNDYFEQLERSVMFDEDYAHSANRYGVLAAGSTRSFSNTYDDANRLLTVAETHYERLVRKGDWAKHIKGGKKKDAAFHADGGAKDGNKPQFKGDCFNCGGKHLLSDCPKPKDQAKIDANKAKFLEAKRARGAAPGNGNTPANGNRPAPGTGKWRKPEDHENGLRIIDGKPYKWNATTKRWNPQDAPSSGAPAPAPAAGTGQPAGAHNNQAPSTGSGSGNTKDDAAALRAQIAELTRQLAASNIS